MLTDFEYRVWDQYQLSADDFGVMRCSPLTLQADNDALEARDAAEVAQALERLIAVGLTVPFTHQGRRFICQTDWQEFQKVEYPRRTLMPAPPEEVLDQCTAATRKLFKKYPGGLSKRKRKDSRALPEQSPEQLPEYLPEQSPSSARAFPPPRVTANANGLRLTANGTDHAQEAGAFMREQYPRIYAKARNGAAIRLHEARDFETCVQLVDTYGDRLPLLLEYFLNLPPGKDVLNQPGTPRQLLHMAPMCDSELRRHGR